MFSKRRVKVYLYLMDILIQVNSVILENLSTQCSIRSNMLTFSALQTKQTLQPQMAILFLTFD